jgi:hypothetical protein
MLPAMSSGVSGGGTARGRIIDACVFEPSPCSNLGLIRPPYDQPTEAGPNEARKGEGSFADAIEAMNLAGVRAALVVLHKEVEEFLRVRAHHSGRLYGWAHYDSLQPERGLESVRSLCEGHIEAFLGVATAFPCFEQDPRLKVFVPLYEYCIRRGLPVLFRLTGGGGTGALSRPLAVGVLASVYPRLRIVCLQEDAGGGEEMRDLLVRFPNLFLATNLGPGLGDTPDMQALVRAVGSRKIMFASGRRDTTSSYGRGIESLSRLAWWHRSNVGWRAAARVFGSRIRES